MTSRQDAKGSSPTPEVAAASDENPDEATPSLTILADERTFGVCELDGECS